MDAANVDLKAFTERFYAGTCAGRLQPVLETLEYLRHDDYKLLDRPPTPPGTLTRARSIALANGVRYAYTGNVFDVDGQSTYCPGCGVRAIERDWYRIGAYGVDDGGR